MKVLFLDVDGVLNCRNSFAKSRTMWMLDMDMVDRVKRIIKVTGVKIVLSSTWRNHKIGRNKVKKFIPFIDYTPQSNSGFRGNEIKVWLDSHPEVAQFGILDDDSDMLPEQKLFKTTFDSGLTEEITNEVIAYFGIDKFI